MTFTEWHDGLRTSPMLRMLDLRVEVAGGNGQTLELRCRPDSRCTNRWKGVHGGFLALLFDEAAQILLCQQYGDGNAATLDGHVHFTRALRPHREIVCTVRLEQRAGNHATVEGTLSNGKVLYATYTSEWYIRTRARR
ncbi:MAG: PaaI family thioesterase [Candidatus Kerfeldbacteria bacterium]|nr:PaaI family thioesterase [Candidatus Kerfeldbacteria bacterium]